MDIYSFISSKAVAEHCRSIGKTWNTLEMAVIIDRSRRTIADIHAAWMELVEDYPDMPAMPNYHNVQFDSVHTMLTERIAYEKQAIEWFKTAENGVFYTYQLEDWNSDSHPFTTFEKALANLKDSYTQSEAPNFRVNRVIADADGNSGIDSSCDYNGDMYYIHCWGDDETYTKWFPNFKKRRYKTGVLDWYGFEFDELFFIDIPLPFKRGDILKSTGGILPDIFVLMEDSEVSRQSEWYVRGLRGEGADGSDMQSWAFFVDDTGTLFREHIGPYDGFEYYKDKLEGKDRLLYYVSLFLRDELELVGLLTMQGRLIAEQLLDSNFKFGMHNSHILEHLIYENLGK